MDASELKAQIKRVIVTTHGNYYRVSVELKSGEKIVIKKKATKAPKAVQLYDVAINGNARDPICALFTFAVTVDQYYRDRGNHLATYNPVML